MGVWVINRYWGGLFVTAFIGLAGLYFMYKAIRGEDIILDNSITLTPKILVIAALFAESVFFLYVYLGIKTGVFDLLY